MKKITFIPPHKLNTNEPTLQELSHLYKLCFDDSSNYIDFYFIKKIQELQVSYLTLNNQIISALYLKPQRLSYHHTNIKSGLICGASTHPEHVKKGYMRKLLAGVFQELYQKNIPLVTLHPFKEKFYSQFGFIPYTFYSISESKRSNLYSFRKATHNDIKTLLTIYQDFVKGYDIYPIRTLQDFQKRIDELASDDDEIIILSKNNNNYGYYILVEGIVEEYCSLNDFFTKNGEYVENIASHKQLTLNMARVINPLILLQNFPFKKSSFQASFKIIDEFIPQNNLTIQLQINNDVVITNCNEFQFEISIEELSTLLLVGNILNNPHPFYQLFKVSKNISWEKY